MYGLLIFLTGDTNKKRIVFLIVSFLHLALLMGLRGESVGIDTAHYNNIFLGFGATDWSFNIRNWLYLWYCKLIFAIYPNPQIAIFINSFIICAGVAVFVYNFSKNVVISTYLYVSLVFYFFAMNGARQSMAMSFFLLSCCLIKRRRISSAVIVFILATGMHFTIIAVLPMMLIVYLYTYKQLSNKFLIIFGIVVIFVYLLYSILILQFANLLVHIVPNYGFYLSPNSVHNIINTSLSLSNSLRALLYLLFVAVAIIIVFHQNKRRYYNPDNNALSVCLIAVSIGAILVLASNNMLVARISEYYYIFNICLIPNIIERFRKEKYLFYSVTIILFSTTLCFSFFNNSHGMIPYQFFFE